MPQELKDIYENENLVLSVQGSTTLYVTAKNGDAMIAIEVIDRTIRVRDVDGDVIFTPRAKLKKEIERIQRLGPPGLLEI